MAERPPPCLELDWDPERARAFAEDMVDLWLELLRSLRTDPVVPPQLTREQVVQAVALEVPEEPLPQPELVAHLRTLLDHSLRAGHPAHLSYITGSGTIPGAAADLLASGLNPNVGGWLLSPAATEIELALTGWLARQFDLPDTAAGLIVAGGAIANFIALKTARDAATELDARRSGVGRHRLAVYCSEEAHVTIDRAADMLGLGSDAVRHIPVDRELRMEVGALETAVRADAAEGTTPAAIVATAGTTGTGAIDPLPEIADVAAASGAWFHVDAAYGGPAVLADELKGLFRGIERADSITLDPHKWLSTPLGSGCILIRDRQALSDSFGVYASYVHEQEDLERGVNLGFMGPQFSRGFDALKVWVSLLAHGRAAYGRRIAHDVELTRYLAALVDEHPDFELVASGLSICCFRYRPSDVDDEEYLDRLNERLMTELQLDGRVYPSNAIVHGRFCLRTCIVNYRTEAEDLEGVLEVAEELGARLYASASSTLPS